MGAYSSFSDPLAGFKGPTSNVRAGQGRGRTEEESRRKDGE